MEPERRYQIISTIGSGDFATVYRARDVELEREVAIKQIHSQFMQDPRQLDRYWHEAQILANLHHQYIMTIYDIVRGRGWLILELMRGALAAEMQGRPIDVETMRIALTQSLHALDFLHSKGILHGDVKPGNLLISMNHKLKLGDFGLARRAGNAEGSLLKGTAKYMAPEVMSDQFGAVGPASDLYSLGFTAYELLCGEHFESLFPGLNSFGRDKPVAWMMWHAAADRRLPEIGKVLEGVPVGLAAVIEKLIVKDPSRRYRSAAEALEDLKERPLSPSPSAQFEAEQAAAAEQARRKRRLAIAAFAGSLAVSLCALFFSLGDGKPTDRQGAPPPADDVREGVVKQVWLDKHRFEIELKEDRKPLKIMVPPECDVRLSGGGLILLDDLLTDDDVRIKLDKNKTKELNELVANEIVVMRPVKQLGRLREVDVKGAVVRLDVDIEGGQSEVRLFTIPELVKPLLNGKRIFAGQAVTLATLQPDDRIEVQYFVEGNDRRVAALQAFRLIKFEGIVNRYDPERRELEVADGPGGGAKVDLWPLAAQCAVTLNGKFVSPQELAPGDHVTLERDTKVAKIEAKRPTNPDLDTPRETQTPPEGDTSPDRGETEPKSDPEPDTQAGKVPLKQKTQHGWKHFLEGIGG